MARWRHPPSLFLTFSTNVGTSDFLGAWVSHTAGVARRLEVQVWAAEDERERLGAGGDGGGGVLGAPVVRGGTGHLPPPPPLLPGTPPGGLEARVCLLSVSDTLD